MHSSIPLSPGPLGWVAHPVSLGDRGVFGAPSLASRVINQGPLEIGSFCFDGYLGKTRNTRDSDTEETYTTLTT